MLGSKQRPIEAARVRYPGRGRRVLQGCLRIEFPEALLRWEHIPILVLELPLSCLEPNECQRINPYATAMPAGPVASVSFSSVVCGVSRQYPGKFQRFEAQRAIERRYPLEL